MDRRQFLTLIGASFASYALPFQVTQEIAIVDIDLDKGWEKLMSFNGYVTNPVTKDIEMSVSLDTAKLWKFVTLTDADDRQWKTNDGGQTWRSGLLSFEIPQDDDR